MKLLLLFLSVFLLVACTQNPQPHQDQTILVESMSELPVIGEAPELVNEVWLNTDQPLRLADQRGKVVLLEMWTFG
jgi:hypothetical protein